ncbi:hypothetical protein GZH47_00155 [Paenibacillus rhizovicinus]|uniref:rRNA methyltransferase n=1 Tax=Paenibacillus rhizovicinus TaxID=2704463 RepID=A0A6C0NT78_9BACL|nr:hypothetical protein [Paenibacillus rhizovicinus]QHW29394.1 hypothetical protein GZH47_00155 [Paenibacillus rhizovicinus]
MAYMYEKYDQNYEDFASGKVLYNAHGTTSFPVRLASEIIQRCFRLLEIKGNNGPYSLYDPCCGGAYMLTVTGLMHGHRITNIYASDVDHEVLQVAERNLSLLTPSGLARRKEQLTRLTALFQKKSHEEALASLERLDEHLETSILEETYVSQVDITSNEKSSSHRDISIVMTDLPYGDKVNWRTDSPDPISDFFDQILKRINPDHSVVAVITNKGQKLKHKRFKKLQYFKIGKRQIGIFELIS